MLKQAFIAIAFALVGSICSAQAIRTPLFELEVPKGWKLEDQGSNWVAIISNDEDVEVEVTGISVGPKADLKALAQRYVTEMEKIYYRAEHERGVEAPPAPITTVSQFDGGWKGEIYGRHSTGSGFHWRPYHWRGIRDVALVTPGKFLAFSASTRTRTNQELAVVLDDVIQRVKY